MNFIPNENLEKAAISVGNKIRNYRKKNHITQAQFAQTLGISTSTLSSYENGKSIPDMETLVQLTQILGCSTDDILSLNRFTFINEPIDDSFEI